MRRIRDLVGLMFAAAALIAGCETTQSQVVRPPKMPEEYNAPPTNDPRYSGPVEYPREVMEQDPLLKRAKDNAKSLNPMSGGGGAGGPGMRGPGRMSGMGGGGY